MLVKATTDVNEQWDFFKNIFQKAEEKYIPRKTVHVNGKKNKKLNTSLDRKTIQKIKKKNRLWSNIHMNFASAEEELQYNKLWNQIHRLTRKSKKIMEQNIVKNIKTNPEAFWQYVQSNLKIKASIPDLIKPGTEENPSFTETDEEKAGVLSNYFSSAFRIEQDTGDMPFLETRDFKELLLNIDITEDLVIKKI